MTGYVRIMSSSSGPREELLSELRRARDHMNLHYSEPIDLEQLVAVATLSSTSSNACSLRSDVLGLEKRYEVGHRRPREPTRAATSPTTPSGPLPDYLIEAMRRTQAEGGLAGVGLT